MHFLTYQYPIAQHTNAKSSCVRRGFTLVELLVSSTIALMVMLAVASLFGIFSRTASNSQSVVDMTSRMRSTASRLRQDLSGITVSLKPPINPEANAGYFEIIEGPWTDGKDAVGINLTGSSAAGILADTDDVLLFTTRSAAGPFEGRYDTSQIESTTAEVAWFCLPSAFQPVAGLNLQTLYRRQLLVPGYVGAAPFFVTASTTNNQISASLPSAYNTYDISMRTESTGILVPNTLADLTSRENRFLHGAWNTAFPSSATGLTFDAASGREGEDIILTNVISFDVRVFDPDATARLNGSTVVYPSEQSYAVTLPPAGFTGCMVDLGRGLGGTTFCSPAAIKSQLTATYDTWSTYYESNGEDNNGSGGIDEGTNGVDDDGDNIPDDPDEAETSPPYSKPIQALEIRIRCYDPASLEIRQVTVRQTFTN